jgi:hypothetical protein
LGLRTAISLGIEKHLTDFGRLFRFTAARTIRRASPPPLNLAFDPGSTPVKDINRLYVEAWKKGIKSLYYQHGVNAAQTFPAICLRAGAVRHDGRAIGPPVGARFSSRTKPGSGRDTGLGTA